MDTTYITLQITQHRILRSNNDPFKTIETLFRILVIISCIIMIIIINTNADPYYDISLTRDIFNETIRGCSKIWLETCSSY